MNGLEARYSIHLEMLRQTGRVESWRFEDMKFRLANRTFYTPDFWVVLPDGQVELHEVKGRWEDDARVKLKVAAERFHEFGFVAITYDRRAGWVQERFGKTEE